MIIIKTDCNYWLPLQFVSNTLLNRTRTMNIENRIRGFSAMEMLATVGMVGLLSTVSLTVYMGSVDSAESQRLNSHVTELNRAVVNYISHGGNITTATTAAQVLTRLKSVGDADTRLRKPGYTGSFVDGRLVAVDVLASDPGDRALWNNTEMKFEILRFCEVPLTPHGKYQ